MTRASGGMRMLLALLGAGLLLAFAPPAAAQTQTIPAATTTDASSGSSATATDNTNNSNCSQYPGLTNRIAQCVRATIDRATGTFFTGFYPLLSRAITAFVTLGVILYGVAAATGSVERIGRDSVFLLMKIAFITYLTTNVDVMYTTVLDLMDASGEVALQYTPGAGVAGQDGTDFSQIACMRNLRSQAAVVGQAPAGPWLGMDCLLDSVIGLKTQDAGTVGASLQGTASYVNDMLSSTPSGPARGMMYLFFSSATTSMVGAVFAVIGFIFLYGLVWMIIKALYVYLMAYIGIAFLMILSPLFVPLVLMRSTKEYFDKWVKMVISFALQPVIMIIFISMSVAAVDLAAFSGDYSLTYRLAGDASRQRGFDLNKYLSQNRNASGGSVASASDPSCTVNGQSGQCGGAIKDRPVNVALVKANSTNKATGECPSGGQLIQGICKSICTADAIKNDPDKKKWCAENYPITVWEKTVQWEVLADARTPPVVLADGATTKGQQLSRECISAALFCGIVVFVMNSLLKVVPMVAYDLLGDFGQSPNLMKGFGGNKISGNIQKGTEKLTKAIKSGFKGGKS